MISAANQGIKILYRGTSSMMSKTPATQPLNQLDTTLGTMALFLTNFTRQKATDELDLDQLNDLLVKAKQLLTGNPKNKNLKNREALVKAYISGLIKYLKNIEKDPPIDLKKVTSEVRATIAALRNDFESQPKAYGSLLKAYQGKLDQRLNPVSKKVSRRLFLEFDAATYDPSLINLASISLSRAANFTAQYQWEIVNEILALESLDERVLAMQDLIYMMKKAFDEGDYVIASIIFGVIFGNSAISRLAQTRDSLSPEAKEILAEMQTILNVGKKRNIIFETCAPHTIVALDYVPKQLDNGFEKLDIFNAAKEKYEAEGKQASDEYKKLITNIDEVEKHKEKVTSNIVEKQKHVLIHILNEHIKKQEDVITDLKFFNPEQDISEEQEHLVSLQTEKLRLLTKEISIQQELRENKFLFSDIERSQSFHAQLAMSRGAVDAMRNKIENLTNELSALSEQLNAVSLQGADEPIRDKINELQKEIDRKNKRLDTFSKHFEKLKSHYSELEQQRESFVALEQNDLYRNSIQFMSSETIQQNTTHTNAISAVREPANAVLPRSTIIQNMPSVLLTPEFVFTREAQIQLQLADIRREVELKNGDEVLTKIKNIEEYGKDQADPGRKQRVEDIMKRLKEAYIFVSTGGKGFIPHLKELLQFVEKEVSNPENNKHLTFDGMKKRFGKDTSLFPMLKDLQEELRSQLKQSNVVEQLEIELKSLVEQKKNMREQEIASLNDKLSQETEKKNKEEIIFKLEEVATVEETPPLIEQIAKKQVVQETVAREKISSHIKLAQRTLTPDPESTGTTLHLFTQLSRARDRSITPGPELKKASTNRPYNRSSNPDSTTRATRVGGELTFKMPPKQQPKSGNKEVRKPLEKSVSETLPTTVRRTQFSEGSIAPVPAKEEVDQQKQQRLTLVNMKLLKDVFTPVPTTRTKEGKPEQEQPPKKATSKTQPPHEENPATTTTLRHNGMKS